MTNKKWDAFLKKENPYRNVVRDSNKRCIRDVAIFVGVLWIIALGFQIFG